MPQPQANLQRSFVTRRLAAAGARFEALVDRQIAAEVPGGGSETLARLGLVDLSPLPRIGFKGRGTIPAMQKAGVAVEGAPNRAFRQPDGGLCLVLAPGEVIILSGPGGDDALVRRLSDGWSMDDPADAYLMPRASSHAWFRIVGVQAPAFFAKICAIDLRQQKFADLAIAQTSVAKLTAIIVRDDIAGVLGFHVLADSASAEYLWSCLLDAMQEFGGGAVGYDALAGMAGLR